MKIHLVQIALNKMSLKKRTFSENSHKLKLKYVYYVMSYWYYKGHIKSFLFQIKNKSLQFSIIIKINYEQWKTRYS